jgi:hypothetical protein
MKTIDFRAEFGPLYFPPAGKIHEVVVPAMNFAVVEGQGDPSTTPAFQEALAALFGISFTLRFDLKRRRIAEYRVAPLETLWWSPRSAAFDPNSRRDSWRWKAMIMQPAVVRRTAFTAAKAALKLRKDPPALGRLRFERFREGRSAQVLYRGPYSDEGPTIERLHEFIRSKGGRPEGKHHEIYLGDPRRSAPSRLRTVIRQPFVR